MKKINLKRIIALFVIFLNLAISLYTLWTPGTIITNGKHDKGQNGIWIQHGWLGHHSWFKKYKKAPSKFRDKENMLSLQRDLQKHNIKYIYPHLCPTDFQGHISKVDHEQTKNFLKVFNDFKVMPWVGGVLGEHCFPESKKWRKTFIESVIILLESHPSFSGIHLNIEPLPSGNKSLLVLLDELKLAMPTKTLSVAAYPPPTLWHPYKEVHWEKEYFKEVSRRVDQLVPMMYDTGIKLPKFYQKLMTDWSHEVLQCLRYT